jgi:hypothetical protein
MQDTGRGGSAASVEPKSLATWAALLVACSIPPRASKRALA